MEPVTVEEPKRVDGAGADAVSACIGIGPCAHVVQYRVSGGRAATGSEPFLAAALLPAMVEGAPLRAVGPVSARLLDALPTIQDIFAAWDRRFQRVPVDADAKGASGSPHPQGVGCFFSGGVDSWYSLLKHLDEITDIIHIQGFDVRLEDRPLRTKVTAVIRQVADEFRKPLIEVETNLRAFADSRVEWKYYHGAALASVALVLSPRFRKVYVPSTQSYFALAPMGSHPLLDPLWSTEEIEIVHDGCEATRVEKVIRIAACETALRTLRVCWENRGGAYNCGRCRKCLRTMIALRVAGALERCGSLPHVLDLAAVSRIELETPAGREYIEQALRTLRAQSIDDPALVTSLRDCLSAKYYRGIWPVARRVKRQFHSLREAFRWTAGQVGRHPEPGSKPST